MDIRVAPIADIVHECDLGAKVLVVAPAAVEKDPERAGGVALGRLCRQDCREAETDDRDARAHDAEYTQTGNGCRLLERGAEERNGGRWWIRTTDPRRVKAMLYH